MHKAFAEGSSILEKYPQHWSFASTVVVAAYSYLEVLLASILVPLKDTGATKLEYD
jgi:hypothetical protein